MTKNLYKITEFAQILGVTTATLRNKHRSGHFIPSFVDCESGYRFYTDEIAYRYTSDKCVLVYTLDEGDLSASECKFLKKLNLLNIQYKIFNKDGEVKDFAKNKALKDLIKEVNSKSTYTIVYKDENLLKDDLKLIKFYIDSCSSNIQMKKIEDFSFEIDVKGGTSIDE